MKRGFSLIMAIFFVVIIATLGMLSLNFSTKTGKQTVNIYLREQAELYAKSAIDFTVLAMQRNDYSKNCLDNLTLKFDDTFSANVDVIYLDSAMTGCKNRSGGAVSTYSVKSGKGDNMAILDVVVSTVPGISPEPIRFHRRTIQRP